MQDHYRLFQKDIPFLDALPPLPNDYIAHKSILFTGQSETKDLFYNILNSTNPNVFLCTKYDSYKFEDIVKDIEINCSPKEDIKDFCYVYNFADKMSPKCISLPIGSSFQFKNDMEAIVLRLHHEFIICITSDIYNNTLEKIKEEYYIKKKSYINSLSEDDNDLLNLKLINEINHTNNQITTFEVSTLTNIIEFVFSELDIQPYSCDDTNSFILSFKKEIISSVTSLVEFENDTADLLNKLNNLFNNHFINVGFVSILSPNHNMPIIPAYSLSVSSLVGKICIYSEPQKSYCDYIKIIPGLLHQARGGYLILNAKELAMNYHLCETLINALMSSEINIQKSDELCGYIPQCYSAPEPIPLNVKIIIVGTPYFYNILCEFNSNFKKLFCQTIALATEIPRSDENIFAFLSYIDTFTKSRSLPNLNTEGKLQLLRFLSRVSGSALFINNNTNLIHSIINLAYSYSILSTDEITGEDIANAVYGFNNRANIFKQKLLENLNNGNIYIDTTSKLIGQINCLTLINDEDFSIGMPCRITVNTYSGNNGIDCIDKDNEFSGKVFNKSINIINGYMGEKYGKKTPLFLNAHICFEQNYSHIDGDSATCACLVALISSLSDVPILQGIAITGSMDQKGNVQAVGGINDKIEGYFNICKLNTLSGYQGVIIPKSNVKDLILSDEIIKSMNEGYFSIYAIDNIDDAFKTLTNHSSSVIENKVKNKLKRYSSHFNLK